MLGRGLVFLSENSRLSLLSLIGIVYLVSTAEDACICPGRAVTLATGKAFRIEAHAPGSFRHDVTSACFHAKVGFTFQSSKVARSMLYAGYICHALNYAPVHAQTGQCTTQPEARVGDPLWGLS